MSGSALAFPTPASLGSLDHYIQAVNRFPLLTAEQETELGRRWQGARRCRRRPPARAVAPAAGRRRVAQLPGLWPAAGRPDPGRQHRPDEGRAPLRPRARRAPGVVRAALDPRRDPRARPAQLAAREDRDDQGAAEAVLQPAQHEALVGGADAFAKRGEIAHEAGRQARGSARDGDADLRRRRRRSIRRRATRTSVTPIAYLTDTRRRAGADPRTRGNGARTAATACARAMAQARRAQPPASSRRAGCATTTMRPRCSSLPTSTASPPSGSARSRARR